MRTIIALLFLLPVTVFASHHREHAAWRLDYIGRFITDTIWQADSYASVCALDAASERNIHVVRSYMVKMERYAPEWAKKIRDNVDLDLARRGVSQPANGGGQSMVAIMAATLQHAKRQIGYCEDGDLYLQNIMTRISTIWGMLDQVAWHIDDAIREEVYHDPEFICSGPGNHCGDN